MTNVQAVLEELQGRERVKRVVDVNRLRYNLRDKGITLSKKDVKSVFKGFEKEGKGKFFELPDGRIRFECAINFKTMETFKPLTTKSAPKQQFAYGKTTFVFLPNRPELEYNFPPDLIPSEKEMLLRVFISVLGKQKQ